MIGTYRPIVPNFTHAHFVGGEGLEPRGLLKCFYRIMHIGVYYEVFVAVLRAHKPITAFLF